MEKITEEIARKLLDLFVYRDDDGYRDEIRKPYLKDGCICATDTYALIRMSRDYFPNDSFQQIDKYNIAWPGPTVIKKLSKKVINMAVENLPMVDVYIEEDVTVACPDCDGTGNVEWEYNDLNGNTHQRDFECPVCDGEGTIEETVTKPTGKKERDKDYFVKIGDYCVKSSCILLLHDVMELCGAEEIIIKGASEYLISFELAEGIEMLFVNVNPENRSYIEIPL